MFINGEQACNNRQVGGKDLFPFLHDPFCTRSASLPLNDNILSSHWIYIVSVLTAKSWWVYCRWCVWRRSTKWLKIRWPCHPKWNLPLNSEVIWNLVNKLKQTESSLELKLSDALQYVSTSLCLNRKKEVYLFIAEKKNSMAAFMEGPQGKKTLNLASSPCSRKLLAVFEKRNPRWQPNWD